MKSTSHLVPLAFIAAVSLVPASAFAQHQRESRGGSEGSRAEAPQTAQPRSEGQRAPQPSAGEQRAPQPRAEWQRAPQPRVEAPRAEGPRAEAPRSNQGYAVPRDGSARGGGDQPRSVQPYRGGSIDRPEYRGNYRPDYRSHDRSDYRSYYRPEYRGYGYGQPDDHDYYGPSDRGYYWLDYHSYYRPYYYGYYGYRAPSFYYRPFAFRPNVLLGFGIYIGYPVAYPYPYAYYPEIEPGYGVAAYPGAPYPNAPANAYGGVSFTISPGDAAIYIDGIYVGEVATFYNPNQPLTLTAGYHRIQIDARGCQPLVFTVNVLAGQVVPYQGTLQRLPY